MSAIFGALKSIVDFISLLFNFVIDFFKGLADFISTIVKAPQTIAGLSGILPPFVFSAIVGVIAIVIILRCIGRD